MSALIQGTNDSDVIHGTIDAETIEGLDGNDTIFGSSGTDTIDGGEGRDVLRFDFWNSSELNGTFTDPVTVTLTATSFSDSAGVFATTFSNIEIVLFNFDYAMPGVDVTFDASAYVPGDPGFFSQFLFANGDDTVTGSAHAEIIYTNGGSDVVDAGEGFDIVGTAIEGTGAWAYVTFDGTSHHVDQGGTSQLVATGAESIGVGNYSANYAQNVDGSASAVRMEFYEGLGNDTVIGSDFDDRFFALNSWAGGGTDTFTGGAGADRYDFTYAAQALDGTTITDFATEDWIDLSGNFQQEGAQYLIDTFIGSSAFSGTAGEYRYENVGSTTLVQFDSDGDGVAEGTLTIANGAFALEQFATVNGEHGLRIAAPNAISGSENGEVIHGTAGPDQIDSLGGNDTIYASSGADTVDGGDGLDVLRVEFSTPGELNGTITDSVAFTLTTTTFSDSAGLFDTTFSNMEIFVFNLDYALGSIDVTFDASAYVPGDPQYYTQFQFNAGDDTITGSAFADNIYTGRGNDVVDAGDGNDIVGTGVEDGGEWAYVTFDGTNHIVVQDGVTLLTAINAEAIGVGGFATLFAQNADASGNTVRSYFYDGDSDDTFIGSDFGDTFLSNSAFASGGSDTYTGGAGADRYDFTYAAQGLDGTTITDFAAEDWIDLSGNFQQAGVQYLIDTFIGSSAFSGTAGEYRYERANGETIVQFDSDGDGVAEGTLTIANGEFALEQFSTAIGEHGLRIVQETSISGTEDADTLNGTEGDDDITGMGGDDTIYGFGGRDTIDGGAGVDQLFGGADLDTLAGGAGNDFMVGGAGDDVIDGGEGNDALQGGFFVDPLTAAFGFTDESEFAGDDTFLGGDGFDNVAFNDGSVGVTVDLRIAGPQDTGYGLDTFSSVEAIVGTGHADSLSGDDGTNWLHGSLDLSNSGNNNDVLRGFGGDDALHIGHGDHIVDGGSGSDWMGFSGGPTQVSLQLQGQVQNTGAGTVLLTGIENLSGFTANDMLTGNDEANIILGNGGSDTLYGLGGDDTIYGDSQISIGETGLVILGGFASGNAGDIIVGGAGNDTINGELGSDTIDGGDGDDIIDGGIEADALIGGLGNDIFLVDNQGDLVFENAAQGNDTVISSVGFYLYANIENLTLASGAGSIFGVGNELGNAITGNEGANLLLGGAGDDLILGNEGQDVLYGEGGTDDLQGGAGIDTLIGGDGDDVIDGGTDADVLFGQEGNDTLIGGDGFFTDIFIAGEGNDILRGDSGLGDYDLMDGGTGDDLYYVDTGADLTFENPGGGTDTVLADIAGENAGLYLYGGVENLVLLGTTLFGVGNDLDNVITGNGGFNLLLGGAGNDTINGGAGNDILYGQAGDDTFVFEAGSGGDVIADFGDGEDVIDVSAIGFANFAALAATFTQVGNDGAIDLGNGDFIVLHNVVMASLTIDDFVL